MPGSRDSGDRVSGSIAPCRGRGAAFAKMDGLITPAGEEKYVEGVAPTDHGVDPAIR